MFSIYSDISSGFGSSKTLADCNAAQEILNKLRVSSDDGDSPLINDYSSTYVKSHNNPKTELNNYASVNHLSLPAYKWLSSSNDSVIVEVELNAGLGSGLTNILTAKGKGDTKKLAELDAARLLMMRIKGITDVNSMEDLDARRDSDSNMEVSQLTNTMTLGIHSNPKSELNVFIGRHKLTLPQYATVGLTTTETGQSFQASVKLFMSENETMLASGNGNTVKLAEMDAARNLLNKLKIKLEILV